jgi:hypothetical protein
MQLNCVKTTSPTTSTAYIEMLEPMPKKAIPKKGLSVQVPSYYNSDMIRVANVTQQIITELSKSVTGKT